VAAPNGEVRSAGPKLLVIAQSHGDPGGADGVSALADDLELRQDVAEALRDTLETLVDVAEEDLVLDDPFLVRFDGAPSPRPAAQALGTKFRTGVKRGRRPLQDSNSCILRPVSPSAAQKRLRAELRGAGRRWFRAPGRVNLMGDHTDYNEGFVLPMAIDLECVVASAPREDGAVRARSVDLPEDEAFDAYVEGVVAALAERGRRPTGIDAVLSSTVPAGSGLSSSAALEVALALALCDAGGFELGARELALACQAAEQRATGVPSGVMDQLASVAGRAGCALLIDCRSLEWDEVELPEGLEVLVVHSGVPRTLAGSAYADRRAECERFAKALGVTSLRDVTRGQALGHARARHVVAENERVHETAAALRAGNLERVGELFSESHASLRDDYEVSTPKLDALVAALEDAGALGARLTGAGFGGAVVAACRRASATGIAAAATARYTAETGRKPQTWLVQAVDGAGPIDP
jgi:galactokinase